MEPIMRRKIYSVVDIATGERYRFGKNLSAYSCDLQEAIDYVNGCPPDYKCRTSIIEYDEIYTL